MRPFSVSPRVFLKLSAIILQISPRASQVSGLADEPRVAIFAAISVAASGLQRTVRTPEGLPDMPTIAVTSQLLLDSIATEPSSGTPRTFPNNRRLVASSRECQP